jgi:hypothetical protein
VNTTGKVGLVLAAVPRRSGRRSWRFPDDRPEDGVNIGAAMLALLALPLSVGSSVTLIVSRATPRGTA